MNGLGNRHWRRGGSGHCHARRHPGSDLRAPWPAPEHLQRVPVHRSRRTHFPDPENQRPTGPVDRRQARPAHHAQPGHHGPPPQADGQRLDGPLQRRQDPAGRRCRRCAAVPVFGQGARAEVQGRPGPEHDRPGGGAEPDRRGLQDARRHPDPAVPTQRPGGRRRERRRGPRRVRLRRGPLPPVRIQPAGWWQTAGLCRRQFGAGHGRRRGRGSLLRCLPDEPVDRACCTGWLATPASWGSWSARSKTSLASST